MSTQLRTGRSPGLLSRDRSRGLTLIELIVVLVILAAVAGLVMPAVGMLGRSTDMAVTADTQTALASNIQQFFVLQKRYPQGMDSLLDAGTDGTAALSTYAPEGYDAAAAAVITTVTQVNSDNQISGPPRSGPDLYYALEMGTISANQVRSITRGGLDFVFDHQTYDPSGPVGEVNSNMSGKYRRALTSSATQSWALIRRPTTDVGSQDQATMTLLQRLTPTEVTATAAGVRTYSPEAGTRILAFGVGPNCALLGKTSMNIPIYPGCDGKYYGRYIAYFKVYETGERATFLGVTDSYGRTPDYSQQQFNESLPNGGRQG